MNWFKRHLNWTLFFAWITTNIIAYIWRVYSYNENSSDAVSYSLLAIAFILMYGTEIWHLRQKGRSIWYCLIPFIGFFVIINLDNKKKIMPIVQDNNGK